LEECFISNSESKPEAAAKESRTGLGKSLFRESLTYAVGVVGAALIGFVAIPVYTRALGPEEYGQLALAMALTAMVMPLASMGLDVALVRYWFTPKTEASRRSMLASLLVFAGLWSLILTILGCLGVFLLSGVFGITRDMQLLYCLGMASILPAQIFAHLLQVLRNQFRPVAFVAISILAALFGTAFGLFLVVAVDTGAVGPLAGTIVTGLLGCLLALPLVRSQVRGVIRWSSISPLLRLGLPLVPASLAFWIFSGFDRLVVGSQTTDIAGYAVAAQLVLPMSLLVTAIGQAWLPRITSEYEERPNAAANAICRGVEYFLAAFASIAVVIGLLAPVLIGVVAGSDYEDGAKVLPLLATANAFLGASLATSTGALLAKKTARTPLITVAIAVVDIVLLLTLVPRIGILGAGIALLVSYVGMLWLSFAYSQSVLRMPYRTGRLAVLSGVAMLQAVLLSVWPSSPISWLAAAIPIAWLLLLLLSGVRHLIQPR
jgi:O-antigen/teichoic acid export membrane protein